MKIFDGVELKPEMSPTMRDFLSLGLLIGNSFLEADKCREERLAGEKGNGPSTLQDVMAQSGLKIPGLEEMLLRFMGGTEEGRQVATMVANSPDPVTLLKQFAEFGFGTPANTGPVVTPPPQPQPPAAAPPVSPTTAPPGWPIVAPPAAVPGYPPPPAFRPEFTREGREAIKAAERAAAIAAQLGQPSVSPPPAFRPEFTREGREAAKAAAAAAARAAEQVAELSLVNVVERQLGAARRHMKAHVVELDIRLTRAEAEIAALRRQLNELLAAKRQAAARDVVEAPEARVSEDTTAPIADQAADEPAVAQVTPPAASDASASQPVTPPAASDASASQPVTTPAASDASASQPVTTPAASDASASQPVITATCPIGQSMTPDVAVEPEADNVESLPAATAQEVVCAVELVGEFTEELEVQQQKNLERLGALESELVDMRALVESARGAVKQEPRA